MLQLTHSNNAKRVKVTLFNFQQRRTSKLWKQNENNKRKKPLELLLNFYSIRSEEMETHQRPTLYFFSFPKTKHILAFMPESMKPGKISHY